jgi:hypothetical protein
MGVLCKKWNKIRISDKNSRVLRFVERKITLFEARPIYIWNCVCIATLDELIHMLFHFKLIYCGVMLTIFGKGTQ